MGQRNDQRVVRGWSEGHSEAVERGQRGVREYGWGPREGHSEAAEGYSEPAEGYSEPAEAYQRASYCSQRHLRGISEKRG